ncbi:MAG: RpiB/LacA/LacB family sugar-phosphate isomerase [Candidatus Coatesbacteria bacterium]
MATVNVRGTLVPVGPHTGKTIYLGADHRGFGLKEWLKPRLRKLGFRVVDVGTHSPKRVDYPQVALRVARPVSRAGGRTAVGIGVCGSSIGIAIVAGKLPGVLPANPATVAAARETRTHNNTNFLALSGDHMTPAKALAIAKAWLTRPFAPDPVRDARYIRRYLQTVRLDRG